MGKKNNTAKSCKDVSGGGGHRKAKERPGNIKASIKRVYGGKEGKCRGHAGLYPLWEGRE